MSLITQDPYVTKPFTASSGYGILTRSSTGSTLLTTPSFYNSDFASVSSGVINFSKSGKYLIEFNAKLAIISNLNSTGVSSSKFSIKKNSSDICYFGGVFNYSPVNITITNLNFQNSDYWLDTSARSTLPSGTVSGTTYSADKKFHYNSQVSLLAGDTISISLDLSIASSNATTITYRDLDLRITEMAN